MERIKSKNFVAGVKQTKKAVCGGRAYLVYAAKDADMHICEPLKKLCAECGVELCEAESMKELAKACGVEVPTAAVALVKDA